MATDQTIKQTDKTSPVGLGHLNHRLIFVGEGRFGIPTMKPAGIGVEPTDLIKYKKQLKTLNKNDVDLRLHGVHFFVDDAAFESVWNFPHKPLGYLKQFKMTLTPDFSTYRDWPIVMQMWNVYRNRWLGCFWQSKGMMTVPTIGWSTYESFEFAFCGVERGSAVAVSAIGLNRKKDGCSQQLFVDGFSEMIRVIDPCLVMTSGAIPQACRELVRVRQFPTYWDSVRHLIGSQKNKNKKVVG